MARKNKQLLTFDRAVMILLVLSLFVLLRSFLIVGEEKLERDAEMVLSGITGGDGSVTVGDSIDDERIANLESIGYENLKEELGVESDFCIYFEDINGMVVKAGNFNSGLGSNKITVNGEPCAE